MKNRNSITSRIAALLLAAGGLSSASALRAAAQLLVPDAVIILTGSKGKFDFLEVDAARHRLLAAHEQDDTADFFDLNTRKLITREKLGSVVHTIVDPETGRYFCSAQGEKTIVVLDGATFKELAKIELAGELDALVLVPKHHRVYAAHDNGTHLWAVDTDTYKTAGEVAIPGAPELMAYDQVRDRIYLNIKTADETVVVDPQSDKIVAHWPTAPAAGPHGLAYDVKRDRIYVAGANGKLVAIDLKTGRVVASADIVGKVDQAAYDPISGRVYCAGDNKLSIVQVSDSGLKSLGDVPTAATAKNVAVDPKDGTVWTTYTDGRNAYAKSWKLP